MRKSDRRRLDDKLAQLTLTERQRLFKLAGKMRKASQNKSRKRPTDYTKKYKYESFEKDVDQFHKRASKAPLSIDEWALKILDDGRLTIDPGAHIPKGETFTGTVTSVKSGSCTVLFEHEERNCILRPELAMAQRSDLAVGDIVDFTIAEDETNIVEQVHPRSSILSRPDPFDARLERVIATNIDVAVIVVSVKAPPLKINLIDRYNLAILKGGVSPVICVNKVDMIESDEERDALVEELAPFAEQDIPIVYVSAETGDNVDSLLDILENKLTVFVGHSGVGKSSLLNSINPDLNIATGRLGKKNAKGRHTTVHSALYELSRGIRVIDTPGIRSLGMWKITPEQLRGYFNEFDPYAPYCKFSDCSHTHEPDCIVRQAVDDEKIPVTRYLSYVRILESLQNG